MEATATHRNAEALVGQPGLGGTLGTLNRRKAIVTWPAAHVKRCKAIPRPNVILFPRKAADLIDCVQEVLENCRLSWLERAIMGRVKARLARAISLAMRGES